MIRPLIFLGTTNLDVVFFAPQLPLVGQSLMGRVEEFCGGKGANQAVAAARLGAKPQFATLLGQDDAGDRLSAVLTGYGVQPGKLGRHPSAQTGKAVIFVGGDGSNMIGIDAGANEAFTASMVRDVLADVPGDAVMVVEMGLPLDACRAALAARGSRFLIFNPAPVRAQLSESECGAIDILTPNETEAEELTGRKIVSVDDAMAAAGDLLAKGVGAVAITLGASGVVYRDADRRLHQPVFPVAAVDTTAAGDAFNGSLATAIAEGKDIAEALRFAVAVACLSVTRKGAQPSMPSRFEVQEFMKKEGGR